MRAREPAREGGALAVRLRGPLRDAGRPPRARAWRLAAGARLTRRGAEAPAYAATVDGERRLARAGRVSVAAAVAAHLGDRHDVTGAVVARVHVGGASLGVAPLAGVADLGGHPALTAGGLAVLSVDARILEVEVRGGGAVTGGRAELLAGVLLGLRW